MHKNFSHFSVMFVCVCKPEVNLKLHDILGLCAATAQLIKSGACTVHIIFYGAIGHKSC